MVRYLHGGRLDNCWSQLTMIVTGRSTKCLQRLKEAQLGLHIVKSRVLSPSALTRLSKASSSYLKQVPNQCCTAYTASKSREKVILHLTSSLLCDCSAAPCAAMPLALCHTYALAAPSPQDSQRQHHGTLRDVKTSTRACVISNLKACTGIAR